MASFAEWQHRFKASKPFTGPGYENRRAIITVDAGLHHLQGNRLPYFSVTCDVRRVGASDIDSGGCQHDLVRAYWPELEPVIRLHLSDSTGEPMHAEANGWYWLAGYYGGAGERFHGGNTQIQHWRPDGSFDGYRYSTPEECLVVFADHVRVPVDVAKALADGWQRGIEFAEVRKLFLGPWIEAQAPRWEGEAAEARKLLDKLIAEQDA